MLFYVAKKTNLWYINFTSILRSRNLKTLFVSDLDGTLLTSEERISDYSLVRLNGLIDGGLTFTYATARSLNSAAKACWGLRQIFPVILYNGAVVMEPWSGKKLYNNHFNDGQLAFLKELFQRFDVWPLVYSFHRGSERVSWVEGKETSGVLRYLSRRKGDGRLNPVRVREDVAGDEIFYFTCIGKREDLEGVRQAVENSLDMRCIFEQETYQTDYWCEIMPRNTSKGAAALAVKEYLKADRLVAFGDGINDISLFRAADESYAVRNAVAELKAVCTGEIGYSEEDGVVKFIMKNLGKYR